MEKEIKSCRVLIIGSGPAGLTAAIYTARAGLKPIVLTGPALGGQASLTSEIENYPGFPESIGGPELLGLFQQQAEKFGAVVDYDLALNVDFSVRPFAVEGESAIYHAEKIIIASGSQHMLLGVPGEKEFTGRGVSYCATCDGFFYRNKEVAVVGGGNAAVEEAIFLTNFASKVTVIHRRDTLRAEKITQEKAFSNPKINFIWDSVAESIEGEKRVSQVRLRNVKTNEESTLPVDGVFIFVGTRTVTDFFAGKLEMSGQTIKVNSDMMTSIEGVYAAGESVDPTYRQVIVSAGSGAQAGIAVTKAFQ